VAFLYKAAFIRLAITAPMLSTLVIGPPMTYGAPANIALNPSGSAFPSPLESDPGWGGGSYPWDLVDGRRSYNTWARGLAFAWDYQNHQSTINFGTPETFDQVVLWHHGTSYTPVRTFLDYWDGNTWQPISFSRLYGTMYEEGSGSGYAHSDIYTFNAVTGSKIRYSFDGSAGLAIDGNPFIHGWLYEFEVYETIPEPSAMILVGAGLAFLAIRRPPVKDPRC
jgi:hypothetical protein